MLFKHVFIRANNCYRFQSYSNIYDYNLTLLRLRKYSSSLIQNKLYYSYHQNILTNNGTQKNNNLTYLFPTQSILRCKSTESGTAVKDKTVGEETNKIENEKPLTRGEKLKKAVKEYGATVVVFHVAISLASLGTCYLVVTSGLDVTKVFTAIGLNEWMTKSELAASAGTFAVAYAIHKVFAPVRITITLACVPLIVRHLRRIGFLKK